MKRSTSARARTRPQALQGRKVSVTIAGAHPAGAISMIRYTDMLAAAYTEAGYEPQILRPTDLLSKRLGNGRLLKWAIYLEGLVIFPFLLYFRARSTDVLHVADHSDASWLVNPLLGQPVRLVTCHDLIALRAARGEIPEHRTRWTGRIYQEVIRRGLMRATTIVSVSATTNRDVIRLIPEVESVVVPNPYFRAERAASVDGIGGPYALIVSTNGWRKRRELGIAAWKRIRDEMPGRDLRLIIVGPPYNESEAHIMASDPNLESFCETRTNVPEQRLHELYANATFLIQSSKYEGFAWPIIEANAFGVPALCADEPILQETGSGNVFFDANELEANDWKILAAKLLDPRLRETVRGNASRYSWRSFAEGIEAVVSSHTAQRE